MSTPFDQLVARFVQNLSRDPKLYNSILPMTSVSCGRVVFAQHTRLSSALPPGVRSELGSQSGRVELGRSCSGAAEAPDLEPEPSPTPKASACAGGDPGVPWSMKGDLKTAKVAPKRLRRYVVQKALGTSWYRPSVDP